MFIIPKKLVKIIPAIQRYGHQSQISSSSSASERKKQENHSWRRATNTNDEEEEEQDTIQKINTAPLGTKRNRVHQEISQFRTPCSPQQITDQREGEAKIQLQKGQLRPRNGGQRSTHLAAAARPRKTGS
jgi:hypothetical protein